MIETEGVIKFSLDYTQIPLPAEIIEQCSEQLLILNAWRCILKQLGMIGQDPRRYGGLGFGNLSIRVNSGQSAFLITGTQTGHLGYLYHQHLSLVISANLNQNCIEACGDIPPSSEALTHASIYSAAPSAQAVIHIHYPLIWQLTSQLGIVATAREIEYGTQEMATAVANIVKSMPARQSIIFSMLGHEDGIVGYGENIECIARHILSVYASALVQTYETGQSS